MIPNVLRPALRAVRHAPDRVLHSSRRSALKRRLGEQWPREIGFVCYGNICRSPYAEVAAARAFQAFGPVAPRVWSAGLFGPGRGSPDTAREAARERKYDLESHRSQLITSRHLPADWIFVMEPWQVSGVERQIGGGQIVLLGDLDPSAIDTRAIPDPINQDLGTFRSCYLRIERCIGELTRALRTELASNRVPVSR